MSNFKLFMTVISLTIFFTAVHFAQIPRENEKEVSRSPNTIVKNSDYQYLIGVGDVLDIRIYNRPQLSREAVRVDGRGMIRMPLIKSEIRASCRTDTDLAREIRTKYLEYLRNPHVEVFIKDFQSKPVAVIGAVREPGRFQLQRQIRLLELISFAGGPTEQAGGRVQVRHDSSFVPCNAEKKNNQLTNSSRVNPDKGVAWYELKDLLVGGELNEQINPLIKPGDIVNLIESDKLYVIGNVFKPTVVSLKEPITLTQAIAMAGGILPNTNLDRIQISRRSKDGKMQTMIIADLKAIKKKKAEDIFLRADDIVEVTTSKSKKFFNGLLNAIAPGVSRLPVRVIP